METARRVAVYKHYKYRILAAYLVFNFYPFYHFTTVALSLGEPLLSLLTLGLSVLWVVGIVRYSPHIITAYYVLTGSILFTASNGLLVEPSSILVFSIISFIGDYIGKLVVFGFGYRRISLRLSGIMICVLVLAGVVSAYTFIAYLAANLSIYIVDETIKTTPHIFMVFFKIFVDTRIGSLLVFIMMLFLAYYVLESYIDGILLDTLGMTPSFALHRIYEYVREEVKLLVGGKDSFVKLYVRSVFFIVGFFVFMFLYPIFDLMTSILDEGILAFILSGGLWFGASMIIYGVIRSKVMIVGRAEIKPAEEIRVTKRPLIFSIIILCAYLYVLWWEGIPVQSILLRSLGFSSEWMGIWTGRDIVSSNYLYFTSGFAYYSMLYINRVQQAYYTLSKVLDMIIKFLWG